jgi:ABC-type transporter Mla MlaB component
MNAIICSFRSFLACKIARRIEIRTRRFRRAMRDEHREAMRLLQTADRRARGLRLYAAWSSPRRAVTVGRPLPLLACTSGWHSSIEEWRNISDRPYSLELAATNAHADPIEERPAEGVRVRAEFIERNVLIDLNEVTSIESGRIAILIDGMNLIAARGGNLAIFGVRDEVHRVLKIARLDQVFRIFSTREEALASQC